MCPSYQATLDERHSTRGRGNALRLAITGALSRGGTPDWSDAETIKTLDLCLSCKACKSECPSNVDIARLKAEYTAQRFRASGRVPLVALATGHVRILNRIGSIAPGMANAVSASGPVRAIINRIMGMHPKRTLPRFSRSLYRRAGRPAGKEGSAEVGAPEALPDGRAACWLFTDCFTTYTESHIGLATMRVLQALGYSVRLSPSHCCGRSMISVGMLPQAIDAIDAAVNALRPAIEDDSVRAIIVCEPSCLSAMKDEWLSLRCRTPIALRQTLAAKAMLPEDFVERFWDSHPTPPALGPSRIHATTPVLLHTHCHQKSLWGAESSARLLRRLVGDRLKALDTGCCGMAGSFGFAREKHDLSMQIGELSLLPIVREAPADAIIVATGTSCRHQIHDGAARRAIHPIELAAMLLGVR
jgi:Fe-S oxidoreductase